MTVADLITGALIDLSIIQAGETPSAEDSAVGLSRLNDWIDANKILRQLIYTRGRFTWTLGSAPYYTLGSQATINMPRPTNPSDIEGVAYIDTAQGTPATEMQATLYTDDAYRLIAQKSLTSTYPNGFHYEPTFGVNGWGTLTPWPIPTSTTLRGVIYAKTPVEEFDSSADIIYLPPGYRLFFRTNLAMQLASAFSVPVPPQVQQIASDTMRDVKASNVRMSDLGFDADLVAPLYNINSDTNSY